MAEPRGVDQLRLVPLVLRHGVGLGLERREGLLDLTQRVAEPAVFRPAFFGRAARGRARFRCHGRGLYHGASVVARPQPRHERREVLGAL